MDKIHNAMYRQGLVRPRDGRILGGVCAGLGRRFDIDPWPARILFVAALMLRAARAESAAARGPDRAGVRSDATA